MEFGFEIGKYHYMKIYCDDLSINVNMNDAGDGLFLVSSSGSDDSYENEYNIPLRYIKWVHQLQNIYFTITGEELELKSV